MSPAKLKNDFGSQITFHGGIDTQWLLPKGSADEVGAAAVGLAKTLGRDGGFILAAAHCIQEDVPPENIVAMFRSVKEMGR
jgi:uroporphyrinogen decarboxylase